LDILRATTLVAAYSAFLNQSNADSRTPNSQYGLTCDTVELYNLVLPDGTITTVDSSKSDLFFALKGGLNRFGIVTSIVYKSFPQVELIYGGILLYGSDAVPALIAATNTFQSQNTDPKAQVILTLNGGLTSEAILILFYDGPNRPAAFDPYNDVASIPLLNTVATQSYSSFVAGVPSKVESGNRGAFHTMMTKGLTTGFLNAVYNESVYWSTFSLLNGAILLSYDVEPFMNYGQYATDSAFPHSNSPLPLNLYYSWTAEIEDAFWRGAMQQSIDHLIEVAKAEGVYTTDPAYPNCK